MRRFSRKLDEQAIEVLQRRLDRHVAELSRDRVEMDNALREMADDGDNKFAIDRARHMFQYGIDSREIKIKRLTGLISVIMAETASTAPEPSA